MNGHTRLKEQKEHTDNQNVVLKDVEFGGEERSRLKVADNDDDDEDSMAKKSYIPFSSQRRRCCAICLVLFWIIFIAMLVIVSRSNEDVDKTSEPDWALKNSDQVLVPDDPTTLTLDQNANEDDQSGPNVIIDQDDVIKDVTCIPKQCAIDKHFIYSPQAMADRHGFTLLASFPGAGNTWTRAISKSCFPCLMLYKSFFLPTVTNHCNI
jgi:hypothetical protein